MIIGELNKRAELQSSTPTMDYGEETLTWTTYATVWAGIKPVNASESTVADQVGATATHRIKIRALSTVKPSHRVVINSITYEINGILDYEHINDGMHLLCSQVVE